MIKKTLMFLLCFACLTPNGYTQSYFDSTQQTIPGMGGEVFDTIVVSGLVHDTLSGTYGLDTMVMNISYINDPDLTMSLIAPDGTVIQLANWPGGGGVNFTGTCFDMRTQNFISYEEPAPFTGHMQPEGYLGNVNNGQNGNGVWVLHVVNTASADTGVILNWGLYFDSTPAPAPFFDTSTLPIVVVDTRDTVVPFNSDTKVRGRMGIIDNGPGAINHITDTFNNYNGYISIKVRGNSSRYFPTKSYDVETEDSLGNNYNVPILGMPSDNDWVLYAPWDDKAMIRNIVTYQLSNDMGEYAPRTRLCQLVLNGDYRGVYVMLEKIKQGHNRVDVHKMHATDTSYPNVSGGYIYEVDMGSTEWYDYWFSNYLPCDSASTPIKFAFYYPKKGDITDTQRHYIAAYTDSFESALKNVSMYDTLHGYRNFIDVQSFIDQSMLQEIGHNVDGYRLSSFIHKDRKGKLIGGPIWDFNEAFGNSDYYNGWAYNTFIWDMPCPFDADNLNPFWWQQFLTDTTYVQELKCRYTTLRQHVFDTVRMNHMIDSLASMLQVPQQQHYKRWPILGIYEWPEYYVGTSYADEVNYMKTWLQNRVAWMDSALLNPACIDTPVDTTTLATAMINPDAAVKIYPNPTENVLNIVSTQTINSIEMYNVVGQVVYANDNKGKNFSISLQGSHLPSGMYDIVLFTDAGEVRRKIIVSE